MAAATRSVTSAVRGANIGISRSRASSAAWTGAASSAVARRRPTSSGDGQHQPGGGEQGAAHAEQVDRGRHDHRADPDGGHAQALEHAEDPAQDLVGRAALEQQAPRDLGEDAPGAGQAEQDRHGRLRGGQRHRAQGQAPAGEPDDDGHDQPPAHQQHGQGRAGDGPGPDGAVEQPHPRAADVQDLEGQHHQQHVQDPDHQVLDGEQDDREPGQPLAGQGPEPAEGGPQDPGQPPRRLPPRPWPGRARRRCRPGAPAVPRRPGRRPSRRRRRRARSPPAAAPPAPGRRGR